MPLSRDDLATLTSLLGEVREALLGQLDASRAGAAPVSLDEPIGRISRMDAIQQQAMTTATRLKAKLRLTMVEAALERCARGTYGACVDCGDDIELGRLRAKPESPFCFECQEEREG